MFALIFARRWELWRYRDPAAWASYTALSIWSRASKNLLDGVVLFFMGGGLGFGFDATTAEVTSQDKNQRNESLETEKF